MRFLMYTCCFFLGFTMLSCGGKESTNRDPNILNDGSTVYGDGTRNNQSSADGEEEISADPTSYTDYGGSDDVSSSEIDISTSYDNDLANLNWPPIYFDFDQSTITQDAMDKLRQYAEVLKARPDVRVLLEGHCDFRGTEDYNLALGERRAQTVKRYFLELGVRESQMRTISYGELRPEAQANDEAAWAKNRRVSFAF